jgi:hypothetical protein
MVCVFVGTALSTDDLCNSTFAKIIKREVSAVFNCLVFATIVETTFYKETCASVCMEDQIADQTGFSSSLMSDDKTDTAGADCSGWIEWRKGAHQRFLY